MISWYRRLYWNCYCGSRWWYWSFCRSPGLLLIKSTSRLNIIDLHQIFESTQYLWWIFVTVCFTVNPIFPPYYFLNEVCHNKNITCFRSCSSFTIHFILLYLVNSLHGVFFCFKNRMTSFYLICRWWKFIFILSRLFTLINIQLPFLAQQKSIFTYICVSLNI